MAGNSDSAVPTEQAVKEYVDAFGDARFIPAAAFGNITSTPTMGALGSLNLTSWLLDAATFEYVGSAVRTPNHAGTTINVTAYWSMDSATSGAVHLRVVTDDYADGDDLSSGSPAGTSETTPNVPGTAKTLASTAFAVSMNYTANRLCFIGFGRRGNQSDDTATGDMHFLGVLVTFA
jgi:hypothetical protein